MIICLLPCVVWACWWFLDVSTFYSALPGQSKMESQVKSIVFTCTAQVCLKGRYNLYSILHPLSLDPWFTFFGKEGGEKENQVKKKMSLAGLEPGMLQFMVSALSIAQQRPSEPYYSYNVLYVFHFNNKRNNLRIYSEWFVWFYWKSWLQCPAGYWDTGRKLTHTHTHIFWYSSKQERACWPTWTNSSP